MKRYFSLILAIAATVSAQIVPSTGNVRGPTSATDNAVARYDGTTGKLIQNSGVTIDDSGNLTVSGAGTSTFAGPVAITSSGTSLVQLNLPFTSRIIIGEGATNNANPAITLYRTTGGNAQGTAIRFYQPDSAGNFYIQKGTTDAVYGTETYTTNLAISSAGNLLVGTTTDTGYRLNVKGASDAQMMLDVASGSQYTTLAFANNGSGKGFVYWDNTNNGLFTGTYASNASLKFNTGLGVLALTLDSSQNATFAGNVTASGSGDRSATVETTGSSNAAIMQLKSGNGTTSARYAYLQLISNETSGQTWNVGMYNEKQFSIRDGTTPFLTIANSTGDATFAGKITATGGIVGTTTNDNAATGNVGQYVSSSVPYASRAANTDGVIRNVTSISLTAGDWDVDGFVAFEGAGTTATIVAAGVSASSATLDDPQFGQTRISVSGVSGNVGIQTTGTRRFSIASTTTIYLTCRAFFSAGTIDTYGEIRARRVR